MEKIDVQYFGPWALVTGASSGIGREFARQLAANGFNLVLTARRTDLLDQLGRELSEQYNIETRSLTADLAQPESIAHIGKTTADLDIGLFIGAAGAGSPAAFLDETMDKQLTVVQVNVAAQVALTRYFAERFARRGRGGIELVSAMGADLGLPFMANESGTKAYLLMLGRALNWELKKQGVHVSVLLPSPTDTPIIEQFGFTKDNMPMAPMSVERCVDEGMAALRDNRSSVLTGRLFRWMNRLMPAPLLRAVNARMLGDAARRRIAANAA